VIIDCHCHAGKGDGMTGPWDTHAPLDRYLQRASEAGIQRTVLLAAFHSDYRQANRQIAGIVASNPSRFLGFAFVNARRDAGRIGELVREAVEELGLAGIKVHRHDAPISREVCEAARRFRVPVLYDPMGEVSVCELLATEYPDVDFIIPHLGSFGDDWSAQLSVIDFLARHDNIYADTSGVRRFDLLVEAVRRAGPRKLLFGSDGPWLHPGLELAKVRALGLSMRDESLILGGNLMHLLAKMTAFSGAGSRILRRAASPSRVRLPSPGATGSLTDDFR
jgi:predicted TIM-barrel fold metal-dependent hydrolase